MLPLQLVAAGLVVVLFDLNLGDPQIDLVADPLGWGLVYVGVSRLPAAFPRLGALTGVALLAGVVSVLVWLPGLVGSLAGDGTLLLFLQLPSLAFVALLSVTMAERAAAGGDAPARGGWRLVLYGTAATAVLPTLVYALGEEALVLPVVLLALATMITCVVLCLRHSGRPWIGGPSYSPVG